MRSILHVDMDAFYASVEQLDQPQYKGRPVIVGADPRAGRGRGVVAACSYEARKFGVRSALPISRAWKLCPEGVYVRPRMERYSEVSGQVMEVFRRYTDLVEPLSIDEAFLDITGSVTLLGAPEQIAVFERSFVTTQLTSPMDGKDRIVASRMLTGEPLVVVATKSLDATPANFDSQGEAYGHRRQKQAVEAFKRGVNRRALLRARHLVTWCEWARHSLVDDYAIPAERVTVIHPGVDLELFRPRLQRRPRSGRRSRFATTTSSTSSPRMSSAPPRVCASRPTARFARAGWRSSRPSRSRALASSPAAASSTARSAGVAGSSCIGGESWLSKAGSAR